MSSEARSTVPKHDAPGTPANPELSALMGTPFIKMTGSGNDFVIFDGREVVASRVTSREAIVAICNRHNGIGADGIVYIEPAPGGADARIRYFNSDGSAADLCGNATLCSTAFAASTGIGRAAGMHLLTDAGLIASRVFDGQPEIELAVVDGAEADVPVDQLPGELRVGFAKVGVPHLVVLCRDAAAVDLDTRGKELRWHSAVGAPGANVNFVSAGEDGAWHYRTFERGVEGETLACGTGAVAVGIMLAEWGLTSAPVRVRTSSGRILTIELARTEHESAGWIPTLSGEGRVVFRGTIGQLIGADVQG